MPPPPLLLTTISILLSTHDVQCSVDSTAIFCFYIDTIAENRNDCEPLIKWFLQNLCKPHTTPYNPKPRVCLLGQSCPSIYTYFIDFMVGKCGEKTPTDYVVL